MEYGEIDLKYTKRSLELAATGTGLVSPNPVVGCVIVSADGQVVGEGAYTYEGVTHAEVIALEQAGERARDATVYVSLEPHDHHGKTAPCTEALINAGIARAICPIEDPNPLVSGKGFERLRNVGIKVVTGILADEASRLNEKFICWHKKERPFVHLKLAMSLDGRISLKQSVPTALSGKEALKRVHELRHGHDAILVGGNTAFVDRPSLTDRSGKPRRRPLSRIILDNSLQLQLDSTLVQTSTETPTIVFTNSDNLDKIGQLSDAGVSIVKSENGGRDLAAVLEHLKTLDIQSVLVEGGTEIAGAFCDAKLVDKITFVVAPIIIGGSNAPMSIGGNGAASLEDALRIRDIVIDRYEPDLEITGYPG